MNNVSSWLGCTCLLYSCGKFFLRLRTQPEDSDAVPVKSGLSISPISGPLLRLLRNSQLTLKFAIEGSVFLVENVSVFHSSYYSVYFKSEQFHCEIHTYFNADNI